MRERLPALARDVGRWIQARLFAVALRPVHIQADQSERGRIGASAIQR
jgi:hypothetical protein